MLDPIEINAEVQIDGKVPCTNCPVLNPTLSRTVDNLKLAYVLDCGNDNVCTSDMKLQISTNLKARNRYFIGSKKNVDINVLVENFGEPAYRAQVLFGIPEPILLARLPPECTEKSSVNKTNEVVCNIGNPLRNNVRA